jgi:hypothetical protein
MTELASHPEAVRVTWISTGPASVGTDVSATRPARLVAVADPVSRVAGGGAAWASCAASFGVAYGRILPAQPGPRDTQAAAKLSAASRAADGTAGAGADVVAEGVAAVADGLAAGEGGAAGVVGAAVCAAAGGTGLCCGAAGETVRAVQARTRTVRITALAMVVQVTRLRFHHTHRRRRSSGCSGMDIEGHLPQLELAVSPPSK